MSTPKTKQKHPPGAPPRGTTRPPVDDSVEGPVTVRPTPPRRAAVAALDRVHEAYADLEGTLGVFVKLVDNGFGDDIDVVVAMERHLQSDTAALGSAINKARDIILESLPVGDDAAATEGGAT